MAEIKIQNNVVGENYSKVIDTEFKTFTISTPTNIDQITIDKFFTYYDELFYQIPKEGDTHSHTYILNKTIEYLGVKLADDASTQALLNEITNLKQQILQNSQTIANLVKTNQ
jgi:hypothetical protein